MLNPTRWGGSASGGTGKYNGGVSKTGWGAGAGAHGNGSVYKTSEVEGSTVFEVGDVDEDEDEKTQVCDENELDARSTKNGMS